MIRQTKQITENRENQLIRLRGDYEAAREIMTLKDHPGWKRVLAVLEANLKATELRLDVFQDLTDKGRDFLLKERIDFKWFMDLVEGSGDRLGLLADEIKGLEQDVHDRKQFNTGPAR